MISLVSAWGLEKLWFRLVWGCVFYIILQFVLERIFVDREITYWDIM